MHGPTGGELVHVHVIMASRVKRGRSTEHTCAREQYVGVRVQHHFRRRVNFHRRNACSGMRTCVFCVYLGPTHSDRLKYTDHSGVEYALPTHYCYYRQYGKTFSLLS